jgi:hypothetical protein
VLDPLPDWLVMELAPTGNPPELEAKMTPEVYRMWQDHRRKMYRLKRDVSEQARHPGT